MSIYLDTLPYDIFKKLRDKYPVKTLLITPEDLNRVGVLQAYTTPQEYVEKHFMSLWKVEVYRYRHDYKSLDGDNPKLGLVFMANDSQIMPGLEVHALIGHNARYVEEKPDGIA